MLNSPQVGRRDTRNHFYCFMILTRQCLFNQLLFKWYLICSQFSSSCFNRILTIFNYDIVLALISAYLIIPLRHVIFFILIIMIHNLRGRYFSYVFQIRSWYIRSLFFFKLLFIFFILSCLFIFLDFKKLCFLPVPFFANQFKFKLYIFKLKYSKNI